MGGDNEIDGELQGFAERKRRQSMTHCCVGNEMDNLEIRDAAGIPQSPKKDVPTLARQYLPGTFIVKHVPNNLPEIDQDGLMPLVVAPSHDPEGDMHVLVLRTSPQKIRPRVGVVIHLTKIMYNRNTIYVYD